MVTVEQFRQTLRNVAEVYSVREISDVLDVSMPTIDRWLEGRTFPMVHTRSYAHKVLLEMLAQRNMTT